MTTFEEYVYEITDSMYSAYGSGTGFLFGIPPELNQSVRAIIKLTIEQQEKKVKEAIEKCEVEEDSTYGCPEPIMKLGWIDKEKLLKELGL
jgi:hypothetical protein